MQTIGMFEAKTHLTEVIRNVQKEQSSCQFKIITKALSLSPYKKLRTIFKANAFGSVDDIISMGDEERT